MKGLYFYYLLKFIKKIRVYKIKANRYFLLNEYKYLTNKRISINTKYLFDFDFHIELDESKSEIIIGKEVFFRDGGRITCYKDGKIIIKDGIFFNRNCSINCLYSVEIGNHCLFGENVKIYDHNHKFNNPQKLIKDQGYTTEAVIIGDNCWIGSNSIILKGVRIGENVIIGANNLITKNIPSNSVVKSNIGIQESLLTQ
jgi:acetyltransferase-like isoleucine patch superfamily enzyme